jgi:hypothetical protein
MQEGIDQPVLRELDLAPRQQIGGLRHVRNLLVVAAGHAERVGIVRRDQPVADVVFGVLAEAERSPARAGVPPHGPVVVSLQRDHGVAVGRVADAVTAPDAGGVLEREHLRTAGTAKKLHRRLCLHGKGVDTITPPRPGSRRRAPHISPFETVL